MAPSSDEGEIVENGAWDLKASSEPHPPPVESGVNQDRIRRYSSDRDATSSRHSTSSRRSGSPRGFKRSHDDRDGPVREYYDRRRDQESRPARPRYEDDRRSRVPYDDLDRPVSRASNGYDDRSYDSRSYDRDRDYDRTRQRDRGRGGRDRYNESDRDGYADKRQRNRSRSPQGFRRDSGRDRGRNDRNRNDRGRNDRGGDRRGQDDRGPKDRFVREGHFEQRQDAPRDMSYDDRRSQQQDPDLKHNTEAEAPTSRHDHSHANGTHVKEKLPTPPEPEPEEDFQEPEPIDEEAEIERRRKRREELLSKSSSATPLLLHAVGATDKARASSPASSLIAASQKSPTDSHTPRTPGSDLMSPSSPAMHDISSPGGVDLFSGENMANMLGKAEINDGDDGPSAADYDPTVDMKADELRDELRHGQVVVHGEQVKVQETTEHQLEDPQESRSHKNTKNEQDEDEDEDFDMFAEDFDEDKYAKQPVGIAPIDASDVAAAAQAANKGGLLEGNDKDGYYKIRIGEVINSRYQVQAQLGRGMFSGVVRAVDITTKELVAIKIMRKNDALRKGGYTEIAILEKLNDADPDNRKHIIKFERSFDYKGHLCMTFENLHLNLREVVRKYGNNVGINLPSIKTYAYQMFMALAHMRKCTIIHADLKPDNILVSEKLNVLKICDLGTAIDRSDAATANTGITPYLVSRFYRAPEIILGMPYDYGVDMWSIGCTLYELYTGKILFTGNSNNQMLRAIQEIRGRLTPKLYKRGQLSASHFDDMGQFVSVEYDNTLNKTTLKTLPMVKPVRDLRTRMLAATKDLNDAQTKELNLFIDLLDHCLILNPDKRMQPGDALRHPFFMGPNAAATR